MRPRTLPALLAVALLPGAASAQPSVPTTGSPLADAATTTVLTFAVGLLILVFLQDFAEDVVDRIHHDPLVNLAYGVGALLAFVVAAVALYVTRIGAPLAIVLVVVFALVALVGNVLGLIALYEWLGLGEDLRLVGAAVTAGLLQLLPYLGPVIGFFVGSVGMGAVVSQFRA